MRRQRYLFILSAACLLAASCGVAIGLVLHRWLPSAWGGQPAPAEEEAGAPAPWIMSLEEDDPDASGTLAAVDLEGRYLCSGETAGGRSYRGTVAIRRRGQTYWVLWTLAPGETHRGFGIRHGDVLVVSFLSGSAMGVVSYRIQTSGGRLRLLGRWAMLGMEKPFRETLVKQGGHEILGRSI